MHHHASYFLVRAFSSTVSPRIHLIWWLARVEDDALRYRCTQPDGVPDIWLTPADANAFTVNACSRFY